MQENTNTRLVELDCLRGISAILIMLFHYTTRYEQLFGFKESNIISFSYGKYGVQFFLMTSGFVMMYSYKNRFNIKDFLLKKFFRLYPAYIVSITLIFIILTIYPLAGRSVGFKEYLINITMLQGFFDVAYVDGAHWYLNIEIIFAIWSCIFLYIISKSNKEIVIKILWSWIIILILFKVFSVHIPFKRIINALLLIDYSPFIISGMIFYYLKEKVNGEKYLLLIICLLLIILRGDYKLALATIFLFIIFNLLIYNKLNFKYNKILIFIGEISYPLYLIHQNIGYVIINFLQSKGFNYIFSIIISCGISIIISFIISYVIEKPILNIYRSKKCKYTQLKLRE